jgi:peptidoglycan/LPS O-acetylase OafA/YrhL
MAGTVREAPRVGWLDGLRGIAAMQVVLLHYASAFLPAIGFMESRLVHYSWERAFIRTPLGFLFDGSSAVYLFFIMSGVALTYAFSARPLDVLPAITRRLIRLGLPMAAAILLAATLFSLLPDAQQFAAEQTNSEWLSHVTPLDISATVIAHQIAFEGMLTGFKTASLLPGWVTEGLGLVPSEQSLNPPLWTLHVEFYGSMLVLLLVGVRASGGRAVHAMTCIILGLGNLFTLSPLSLFIVGHVVALWLQRIEGRWWQTAVGSASLMSGILLCTADRLGPVSMLFGLLSRIRTGQPDDWEVLQKMIGACLVFGGLALLPVLQRHLQRPSMRWFGKISFSLYLTHFPFLLTCVAALFTVLNGTLPYAASLAIASISGIAASLAVAALFEHWIDRPAIYLSRMAAKSWQRVTTPAPVIEPA